MKKKKPPAKSRFLIGCLVAAIIATLYLFWYGLQNPSAMNASGFYIGILGLVITLFGFGISIHAAHRALAVAEGITQKILAVNSVSDIAKAQSLVEEIRRLQNALSWIQTPERYSALRHLLITVRETNSTLLPMQKRELAESIQRTSEIETAVQTTIRSQNNVTLDFHEKTDMFLMDLAEKMNVLNIQTTKDAANGH